MFAERVKNSASRQRCVQAMLLVAQECQRIEAARLSGRVDLTLFTNSGHLDRIGIRDSMRMFK